MMKKIIQSIISIILIFIFISPDAIVVYGSVSETSVAIDRSSIYLTVENGATINR